jgi:hypothetical protein
VNSLWADGDGERAFSAFLEEWAVGFLLVLGIVGVDELHIARAQDLETIVEVRSGSQRLGAEAGAGVVNLDEEQWLGGVIAYGGFDVRGVASGEDEDGKQ